MGALLLGGHRGPPLQHWCAAYHLLLDNLMKYSAIEALGFTEAFLDKADPAEVNRFDVARVIDTPGMRELGNVSVETGIDDTFTEILELSEQCQFQDCTHTNEKGCAVLKAVQRY